jgi:hypothetical protein
MFTLVAAAAEVRLGKPLTLKEPSTIADVNAKSERLVGKTVQVKGKVTEVCQMMGCWMALVDPVSQSMIRIKVNDGDIVFPKESAGRMALAEGSLVRLQLSKEQMIAGARHEAEEQGRKFDASKITGGGTIYQIQGTGAVILE